MEIALFITTAILIEAVWENLKMVWKKGKFNANKIGALIVSIFICVLVNIDIFNNLGLTMSLPYVGSVLTGILMSRGANFVHDLFNKINGGK